MSGGRGMSGSSKDNGANGGGDRGDFFQLKAKVIWMILGWGYDGGGKRRLPCIQLGDYLAQSRAMFLANAYLCLFQFLCLDRGLSALQIDACADKIMVIFMCICVSAPQKYNFTEQMHR